MTIQITKREVEALINQRLQTGAFKDIADVVWQALQSFAANKRQYPRPMARILQRTWLACLPPARPQDRL